MYRAIKRELLSIDKAVGALLLGNLAGLSRNVYGQRRLLLAKRGPRRHAVAMAQQAFDLRTRGSLRLDSRYDPALLATVRARFDALVADEHTSMPRGTVHRDKQTGKELHFSRMLKAVCRDIPETEKLVDERVLDVVRGVYGTECRVCRVTAWRNLHVPSEFLSSSEVYSNHWHNDSKPTTRIQLFVNVTDVAPEDGPLTVLPLDETARCARAALRQFPRREWQRVHELANEGRAVQAIGPSGTAFLTMTSIVLHRASIPAANRIRDIIRFDFEPSPTAMKPGWSAAFGENWESY
jgi:hypothetical protein